MGGATQESKSECFNAASAKVEALETELLQKISKHQRSKMSRMQVCTVAQLMTSDPMKELLAEFLAHGVEKQQYAMDSCFLILLNRQLLAMERHAEPVEGDALRHAVRKMMGLECEDGEVEKIDSVRRAFIEPIAHCTLLVGQKPMSSMQALMATVIQILIQRDRLKLLDINLDEFSRVIEEEK